MTAEVIILCLTGIGWLIGQWVLKRREIDYKHFEKKAEIYQKYLNAVIDMPINLRYRKNINLEYNSQLLLEFKKTILILGKPRMIRDFVKYQELLQDAYKSDKAAIETIEFLEKMIRRDLGHYDFVLRKGELAQIFLTDDVKSILKGKSKN
ncbi:MAG: hypothetical protein IJD28_08300 [Deferribacterales bacterium]|nr:hypothetical protein [Deferribacterales bacterium]